MQRLPFHSPCAGVLAPQLKAKAVVNAKIGANAVSADVRCPAGKNSIGGGATTSVAAAGGPMVQGARPFDNGGGREATGVEASAYAGNRVTTAWANCAKVAG